MKIKQYLKLKGISLAEASKILGTSKGHLSLIINEKILPKKDFLIKIVNFTKKKVQPNDFYDF